MSINLAAQSSVALSWSEPLHTVEVTALGCARMLEAIRIGRPQARFYQASSSENSCLIHRRCNQKALRCIPDRPKGRQGLCAPSDD